mgnify:CR=1 FL=1
MAKINVGDLICMYRRKKKGMGIVLEKADDIIESAGAGVTFEEVLAELLRMEKFYNERTRYKKSLLERASRPELINFLPYGDDEYEYSAIYGIIVKIEYAMYSEIFGYEILYVVLGIDGKSRYFSEDEITVIS